MEKMKKNKWIIISVIGVLVIGITGFILINNLTKTIKFKEQSITLNTNQKINLFNYLEYDKKIKDKIVFSIDNDKIANLSNNELIMIEEGNLKVTAKYKDKETLFNISITKGNINKQLMFKATSINSYVDKTIDLLSYLEYEPTIKEKINFTLSDNSIGEIKNSELHIKKSGTLIITAKYENIESSMSVIINNVLTKKCEYEFNDMPKNIVDGNMKLECENVTFKIGNKISGKLIGNKTNDIENEETYKYKLELNINDRKMGTSLFETNGFIWSSNYAASFNIFEFNGLYVFKSNIANICGEDYAVIYDKNGNFIKAFDNVELNFNENNIYEFKCEDIEKETIRKIKYQVESGTLKEIETTNEKWYE